MREYATTNRSVSAVNATELQRTMRELTRLRKMRESRSSNMPADIDRQIGVLERRCEEIIHR